MHPPMTVRCPSEEMNIHRENIVADNFAAVQRIFVGAVCALTHDMLRWSNLQRTSNLSLTADAINGKSEMKNQKYLTPWAAPNKGFSGADWPTPWIRALNSGGLPGPAGGTKLFESCAFPGHAGNNEGECLRSSRSA